MKYDDAEYAFLNFETDLDSDAGYTYIGQYLAWAILNGLGNTDPTRGADWLASHAALREQRTTPGEVLATFCDGKLTDDDLNEEGNAFTRFYYEKHYYADYETTMTPLMADTGHPTDDFCSVPDTWESYALLAPVLDRRYADWKAGNDGNGGPAAGSGRRPDEDGRVAATASAASAAAPRPVLSLEPLSIEEALPVVPSTEAREAVRALRQRAEAGDREAWFDLAAEYLTGQRVPQDVIQAAAALEKAAQMGQVDAQYNLGVCYQRGEGKPKDLAQAQRWWGMAAEAGHASALYMLGECYRSGAGVARDLVAANALMLYAKQRGSTDAARAGVTAGSLRESVELLEKLRQPGQLVAVLAARRWALAAGQVDAGVQAWQGGEPLRRPDDAGKARAGEATASQPTAEERSQPSPTARAAAPQASLGAAAAEAATTPRPTPRPRARTSRDSADPGHFGPFHLALLIGAAAMILLLLMVGSVTGAPLRAAAVVFGLVGAIGSWQVSGELGTPTPMRIVLTLLSALPVFGSFACIAVLLRWVRSRSEH
jgi:hypothetical protein